MCNSKSINELLDLSDEDYTSYIGNLLKTEDAAYKGDELDDEFLKMVDTRPADVERICRINSIVFSKFNQGDMRWALLAYNFNTLMIAAIRQNNIPQSKSIFLEGIAFCRENKQYEAGKSLSQNVFQLFASTQIPLDEAPYLLTQITEFYVTLEKHQDAIEALCAAALYFADASAFQSAYRVINDAQEIAITNKILRSQILLIETQGMVALVENDLDCADGEFQKCFEFYKAIEETPPFQLKSNAALVKMRKEEYGAARDIYETLLSNFPESSDNTQIIQLKTNILVCYRELDDTTAVKNLLPQIEMDLAQLDLEGRIEARLILAKTYFHINEKMRGIDQLKEACIEIQLKIDQYQRLHYRRGVREQYVRRVKSMLTSIETSGVIDDVLHVLVFCSSNALLDWFSVLEWTDLVFQSATVPNSLKDELSVKMEDLICYGTPFLYGFREKYDDPFESANGKIAEELGEQVARGLDYSLPWREFNDLTARICQIYSFPSPFEGASIQIGVEILSRRLLTRSAFLFSFACKDSCVFIFVAEGKYLRNEIPLDNLLQFCEGLFDYQRINKNRNDFHRKLNDIRMNIEPIMTEIVDILENSSISELVFIPDHLTEGFPILPSILESEQLRLRIKESGFVFRTCPALKEESTDSLVNGPSLFVSNSEENLELAESEKALVKNTLVDHDCFEIDLQHEEPDFSKPPLSSAELLHLVTHSVPANIFTDPWFVSTSTNTNTKGVWLESIQSMAHKLDFKLVVLNGCSTGTTSNRNYFEEFLTNEKVGLTSAFLLNRRCAVIATQWNEPEIVGYIFSSLLYKRLTFHLNTTQAFNLALVDMYELTKESAIGLFENIVDEKIRQNKSDALKRSKALFPLRNTYVIGMFQYHSLLVNNDFSPTNGMSE